MQSIDLIEWKWKWNNKYAYGIRKDLVGEKEELKCNNTIKLYKKESTLIITKYKLT